jgi:signal transduction histidine kinase
MKIRLRLILLLGCLLAVFAAATGILVESQRRESGSIRLSLEQQRSSLLDHVLLLTGQSLRGYANDYSQWDDMLEFVRTGEREWARINIDASLPNFGVRTVWVLQPDGTSVYRSGGPKADAVADDAFAQPDFLNRLRREGMMHFYLESAAGLLEVYTAPIQPSSDVARTSERRGWLIASRLWDEAYLQGLAESLQGRLGFVPPKTRGAAVISLERALPDWAGRPVRTLYVDFDSVALARLLEGNADEFYVLLFLGAGMIAVTIIGLSRWVIVPLRRLGESLESGHAEPLLPLRAQHNEFGHLARLVEQSFEQRTTLEREIRARSRLAESLQETSTQLRESVELRNRLARDLHDSVIQAIYAAGIGLEGVRSLLHTDPAGADRTLAASQAALNGTIRDVRAFINGLEAEAGPTRPFRQTLAALVATMQTVQPGNIRLEVDESIARRLSPTQEMQLLNVFRESLSNALRHADPTSITLSLGTDGNGDGLLTVTDDGCGFDPAAPANPGRGLVNLGIRARELGGTLEIDSALGKGTRIAVLFHPTYPP